MISNSNKTYEGLSHSYSVWYPKSVWLFPNANEYKLWAFLFSQYVFQSRYPEKYGDPRKIDIYKSFLKNFLNQSPNTIDSCLKHMQSIGVIDRDKFSNQCTLNIEYVLGAISLINTTQDETVLSKIGKLFNEGDKHELKKIGLKSCFNFEVPAVSSLQINEGYQNLVNEPEVTKICETSPKVTNFCEPTTQNLGTWLQNTTTLPIFGNLCTQILVNSEDFTKNCETFASFDDIVPKNWEGEVKMTFLAGDIIGLSVHDPLNSIKSLPNFGNLLLKICESGTQNLVNYYSKFGNIILYINNNKIRINNTDFSEIEKENVELKKQIAVLLEKNQNTIGGSEDPIEVLKANNSSSDINIPDQIGNIKNSFNLVGEWVPCTEKEISEYTHTKLNDRTVQDIIKSVKDKFIDGSQVKAKTFFDFFKDLVNESFTIELDNPDDEYEIEDYANADLEDEAMTEDERKQAISVKSILELKRFCLKEYYSLFPFFKWEGVNVHVYYQESHTATLEDRMKAFEYLRSRIDSQFTEADLALDDYEKGIKVIDMFNNNFPENITFAYSDMVDYLQYLMIEIGLFSYMGIEYNSYDILDAFRSSIKVLINHTDETATRINLKATTAKTDPNEYTSTTTKTNLKETASKCLVDYLENYSDLLIGFKPPRTKISEDRIIPSHPALTSAFQYLGFSNGKLLEEWEVSQICDSVIQKYNIQGHGLSMFSNTVSCLVFDDTTKKYEVRGLPNNTPKQEQETDIETDEPQVYVRRPRTRRVS